MRAIGSLKFLAGMAVANVFPGGCRYARKSRLGASVPVRGGGSRNQHLYKILESWMSASARTGVRGLLRMTGKRRRASYFRARKSREASANPLAGRPTLRHPPTRRGSPWGAPLSFSRRLPKLRRGPTGCEHASRISRVVRAQTGRAFSRPRRARRPDPVPNWAVVRGNGSRSVRRRGGQA